MYINKITSIIIKLGYDHYSPSGVENRFMKFMESICPKIDKSKFMLDFISIYYMCKCHPSGPVPFYIFMNLIRRSEMIFGYNIKSMDIELAQEIDKEKSYSTDYNYLANSIQHYTNVFSKIDNVKQFDADWNEIIIFLYLNKGKITVHQTNLMLRL